MAGEKAAEKKGLIPPAAGHRRHRLRPRRPRPSANRLGQAAHPARRRDDREQEAVELNSKLLVRDERNKKKESLK